MPRQKYIILNKLRPIEQKLFIPTIKFYDEILRSNKQIPLPDVWYINNQFFIADGHHRIFAKYIQNKTEKAIIPINYYDPSNYQSQETVMFVIDEILKKSKQTKAKQITDLVLK